MVTSPIITVYTLPACVQCNATKRKLDELKAKGLIKSYLIADMSDPMNADMRNEIVDNRGIKQAPYIIVRQDQGHGVEELDAWQGYNPDKLTEWAR